MTRSLFVGTLLALTAPAAIAQESTTWDWNGQLGTGRTVFLRNVNGDVRFEQGTGSTVEVRAIKRWRRADPDRVRIEARITSGTNGGNIIICALWEERATCDEEGYHNNRDRDRDRGDGWRDDNNVSVDFVVRIPANARVDASTVNGQMIVEGTDADIDASTVNGDVEARSNRGRVEANTVNGDVTVRTGVTDRGLDYSTVNGSITLEMPANTNAEVNLSTVNGRISSDFAMTLSGSINPRRIRADIGNGGPTVRVRTVNGSIRLRKL
jgi:DUF4097 and DUF4098 domain-containing protein YvlB